MDMRGCRAIFLCPVHGLDDSLTQQIDVEHVALISGFAIGQQIEQERRQTSRVECLSDLLIAWTVPAGAAAMREYYEAGRFLWAGECSWEQSSSPFIPSGC